MLLANGVDHGRAAVEVHRTGLAGVHPDGKKVRAVEPGNSLLPALATLLISRH